MGNPSKLNKADAKRLSDAQEAVSNARDAYVEARQEFESACEKAIAGVDMPDSSSARRSAQSIESSYTDLLRPKWDDLETACSALRELCEEFFADLCAVWNERSEKWQDSDAGSLASDWISKFEEYEMPDELPTVTVADLAQHAAEHGWSDALTVFDHDYDSSCDAAEALVNNSKEL
jgi:hypothetical protein